MSAWVLIVYAWSGVLNLPMGDLESCLAARANITVNSHAYESYCIDIYHGEVKTKK